MSGVPNSPLFPASQLTLSVPGPNQNPVDDVETYVPVLPDKPLTQTSSIQVYIIPAEKTLFVQGFNAQEYAERPPTLLRGSLYIRVLKPSKIKSISLTFKGQQRTEWPEGIPPKRNVTTEINDIVNHTWPFYQMGSNSVNNGADAFRDLPHEEMSSLNLADTVSRSSSPAVDSTGNFFTRNLSPSFVRRGASPAVGDSSSIFTDLSTTLSGGGNAATSTETDSKTGHFSPGDYIYNFEHPLPASTPETCSVTFGCVEYHFEASIVRSGTFKSNLNARLPIEIVRTPSESNLEENEPIVITRDWEDQLRYDIVIGGKSIVLDSYLPLAFRFVPLWGKVALHRIRVYLTENLEYYCLNKKVHRMEPSKKYLLLEHKAKKGQSLLSSGESNDIDDDVLPRELEFQLYVPKTLDGKFEHQIHPDTSLENILAHHWIKICLRISKKDPENPEKRKHYEISIDSPIHVLSPLAAHGNTLLPAYDNGSQPPNLPTYSSTPPISPGVLPVNGSANNLDAMVESNHFFHLNSNSNNDDPIERDGDMHLEANLYKPDENIPTYLKSPQAHPHPGTFQSPLNSPVQRPIHLIRNPSVNPPPFSPDLDPSTALSIAPPPAYEEETHEEAHQSSRGLSLSPLRIDMPGENTSPMNNAMMNNVTVIPPTPVHETPIKDMLSLQLRNGSRERRYSHESRERRYSHESRERRYSHESKERRLSHESGERRLSHESGERRLSHDSRDRSNKARKSLEEVLENGQLSPNNVSEEDITDIPGSPIHPPQNLVAVGSLSALSRLSSNSSFNSCNSDLPVDQTIPLLNLSSASIASPEHSEDITYRNGSVNSLPYDFSARNHANHVYLPTNRLDMVDGGDLTEGAFAIKGSLSGLRNPRIKTHYQDPPKFKNNSEEHLGPKNDELEDKKERQPSFGVVKHPKEAELSDRSSSSNESEFTINEETAESTHGKPTESPITPHDIDPQHQKYAYVIE